MKVKKIECIQEDEILASPVYTREGEILIPKGTALKKEYVDLLTSLNIESVEIEDKYSSYQSPTLLISQEERSEYVERIRKLLENHIYMNRASLASVKGIALDLVEYSKKVDLDLVYDMPSCKIDLYQHTLNVTLLCLMVARKLKLSEEKYYAIAVGGLLHDLGLRYVTVPYINQDLERISPEEMFEYKKHTILAYTVLDGEEEWLPNISKSMILSHHEKMDGFGFPLKQKNQSIECKIIQACDTFDCLIFGIECKGYEVHNAVEYLLTQSGKKYDKNVMDAMFSMIAKYSVGTEVELSNGKIGFVSKQTKFSDLPIITMLTNADGKIITEEIFNIDDGRDIYISKVI